MRLAAVGLLVIAAALYVSVSTAESAGAAAVQSAPVQLSAEIGERTVAQQQPVGPFSTIPPLVSTIPPLPATPTPIRPAATPGQAAGPTPTRVVPPIPTLIPLRPTPTLAVPAQSAPRAGGFPTEVAVLVFAGSVAALGSGLWMLARGRAR